MNKRVLTAAMIGTALAANLSALAKAVAAATDALLVDNRAPACEFAGGWVRARQGRVGIMAGPDARPPAAPP